MLLFEITDAISVVASTRTQDPYKVIELEAILNGQSVGVAHFAYDNDRRKEGTFWILQVQKEFRRRGVAKQFVKYLQDHGFTIHRYGIETKDGKAFLDKTT